MLAPILAIGSKLLDKFIPDPQAKAQAQLELAKMEAEGQFKELEMYLDDKANARAREIAVKDKVPLVLALIVTLGFFGILLLVMLGHVEETETQIMDIMIGSLGTAWVSIISYYFGSSKGSKEKDAQLSQIIQRMK